MPSVYNGVWNRMKITQTHCLELTVDSLESSWVPSLARQTLEPRSSQEARWFPSVYTTSDWCCHLGRRQLDLLGSSYKPRWTLGSPPPPNTADPAGNHTNFQQWDTNTTQLWYTRAIHNSYCSRQHSDSPRIGPRISKQTIIHSIYWAQR